ncbi:MAG: extracellular solute-binding protein [Treponema sp.]|nr:extracellular solute-binding protein [Treponema sp.]
MKKLFSLTVILVLVAGVVSAQTGRISVWSFTDELDQMIKDYFRSARPRIQVNFSIVPYEQFSYRLDRVFTSGNGVPDVFALESASVRKYVESGQLLDLTDIYETNKNRLLRYPVEVGTHNGRVYALSWHAAPSAMFYRRSLARMYLGTDDPAIVQEYFSSMPKFLETARLLRERSNGTCAAVTGLDELRNAFLSTRSRSWVDNGRLVIDPAVEQYMDIAKELRDSNLTGDIGQWSETWFEGMNRSVRGRNGQWIEIFAYFLPTWGLDYVLKPNSYDTSGDWAVIQGPSPYYWGGTWLAAWRNTPNAEAAKEFIRYFISDVDFSAGYAMSSRELVSNTEAIEQVSHNFNEPFLGGQNHYTVFADIAQRVNGRLGHGTGEIDLIINDIFFTSLETYVTGQRTKQQALSDFRAEVTRRTGIR